MAKKQISIGSILEALIAGKIDESIVIIIEITKTNKTSSYLTSEGRPDM